MQNRQESDRHLIDKMVFDVVAELDTDIPVEVTTGEYDEERLGTSPKFIPELPCSTYEELSGKKVPSECVRLIWVPTDFFYDWKILTRDDINTVIKHEYGHHFTWDSLTEEDFREERFKLMIFEIITHSNSKLARDWDKLKLEYMYFRHRLKSERIASEAVGLTPNDIHRSIEHEYGMVLTNDIPHVDITWLINKPFDLDLKVERDDIFDMVMDYVKDIISNDLLDDMMYKVRFEDNLRMFIDLIYS